MSSAEPQRFLGKHLPPWPQFSVLYCNCFFLLLFIYISTPVCFSVGKWDLSWRILVHICVMKSRISQNQTTSVKNSGSFFFFFLMGKKIVFMSDITTVKFRKERVRDGQKACTVLSCACVHDALSLGLIICSYCLISSSWFPWMIQREHTDRYKESKQFLFVQRDNLRY